MRTSNHSGLATTLAIVLLAAACSSPEKPVAGTPSTAANPARNAPSEPAAPRSVEGYREVPALSQDLATNLADLERDLQNLTARRPEAAKELSDDLTGLADDPPAASRQAIEALVRELGAVLPAATTAETLPRRLSELLFVATREGALSLDRVAELQTEIQKLLVTHSVPEARAKVAAGHVGTLARGER